MKTTIFALLAIACSAVVWAGGGPTREQLPDAGSSILLFGLGVAALGGLRSAFQR